MNMSNIDQEIEAIKAESEEHDDFMSTPVEEIEVIEDDGLHDIPGLEEEPIENEVPPYEPDDSYRKSAVYINNTVDRIMCFCASVYSKEDFEKYHKILPKNETDDDRNTALAEILQKKGAQLPPEVRYLLATVGSYGPLAAQAYNDKKDKK